MSKRKIWDYYPKEARFAPPASPDPTNPTEINANSQSREPSMSPSKIAKDLIKAYPRWLSFMTEYPTPYGTFKFREWKMEQNLRELSPEESKPKWIEIPACRVLAVPLMTLQSDFEQLDEDGQARVYLSSPTFYRRKDGKLFKPARLKPQIDTDQAMYLEEI